MKFSFMRGNRTASLRTAGLLKTNQLMEFILCWLTISGHGTYHGICLLCLERRKVGRIWESQGEGEKNVIYLPEVALLVNNKVGIFNLEKTVNDRLHFWPW